LSFVRANPSGWVTNDPITAAQINALDLDHSRAIDGTGGGSYTPSANVTIAGASSGLIVSAAGGITCSGTAGFACSSSGGATFSGSGTATVSATGGLVVSGAGGLTLSTAGANVVLAARSVIRAQPLAAHGSSGWTYTPGTMAWSTTADNALLVLPLFLPHGAVLNSVTVRISATFAMPATMPTIAVRRQDVSSATITTIGSATDPSASGAVYLADHDINATSLAHTVDRDTYYYSVLITASEGLAYPIYLQSVLTDCAVSAYTEY
jgi:hypothetical protein